MKNDFLKFPLALVVIVAIATAGLAKVYLRTKGDIERQAQKRIQDALPLAMPTARSFETMRVEPPLDSFWVGKQKDGTLAGFAFIGVSKGYSSEIQAMVGLDSTGMIQRVLVLSQEETPGLGTRMEEIPSTKTIWQPWEKSTGPETAWFQDQFAGLDGKRSIAVEPGLEWVALGEDHKAALKKRNAVTALTGATISSNACVGAVSGKASSLLAAYRESVASSNPVPDSLDLPQEGAKP